MWEPTSKASTATRCTPEDSLDVARPAAGKSRRLRAGPSSSANTEAPKVGASRQSRLELAKIRKGEETIQQMEDLGSEFRNRQRCRVCAEHTLLPATPARQPPLRRKSCLSLGRTAVSHPLWDRPLSHERSVRELGERQKQGGHHKNKKTRTRSNGTGTVFLKLCFPGHPISSFKSCCTRGLFQNLQPSSRISGVTTSC